jgi:hypothetical protein
MVRATAIAPEPVASFRAVDAMLRQLGQNKVASMYERSPGIGFVTTEESAPMLFKCSEQQSAIGHETMRAQVP